MMEDIGENLVGSYLRYVEGCTFVVANTHLNDEQGELDLLGIRFGPQRQVIFCEVTTHIRGMQYGGFDSTVKKVEEKIQRARSFAELTFPEDRPRFEIWSPVVPTGALTTRFAALEQTYSDADLDVRFVINDTYTARIQALIDHARGSTKATSDPAYRLLQVLTRLKGGVKL